MIHFIVEILHQKRCVQRDECQKHRVNEQIGDVEIFAVRVPLHLQIFLAQRMGQELDSAVCNHGLLKRWWRQWKQKELLERTIHQRRAHAGLQGKKRMQGKKEHFTHRKSAKLYGSG